MPQTEPVLTRQDIGLIHELGAEQDHPPCPLLPQEAPHLVPGERIQPSRWLIQEQNLQEGWNQTFLIAGAAARLWGLVF